MAEAGVIAALNRLTDGHQYVLGADFYHSTKSFSEELVGAAED